MKVMADTKIIISALLFPASLPAKILLHTVLNHDLVLCDPVTAEVRDMVSRKRPDLTNALDAFFAQCAQASTAAPKEPGKSAQDSKNQAVLSAALIAEADVLVSSDKQVLALNPEQLRIMSPAEFWRQERNA